MLGDGTLHEFFEIDGTIGVVDISPEGASVREIGDVHEIATLVRGVGFGLRRIAAGRVDGLAAELAARAVASDAEELQRRLFGPAAESSGRMVIVSSASLVAMPWLALPLARRRAVTVAPSAQIWAQRSRRSPEDRVVAIAGPDLEFADAEIEATVAPYRRSTVHLGAAATSQTALASMEGAAVAHIAAHGTFRSDTPLFSSLELADGPLTTYDLQTLERPPETAVLAACHAAAADSSLPGELMGTGMALVGIGVRSIVAPLFAVADEALAGVMPALHERLAAGRGPSDALRDLIATTKPGTMRHSAAASLVTIGRHEGPLASD